MIIEISPSLRNREFWLRTLSHTHRVRHTNIDKHQNTFLAPVLLVAWLESRKQQRIGGSFRVFLLGLFFLNLSLYFAFSCSVVAVSVCVRACVRVNIKGPPNTYFWSHAPQLLFLPPSLPSYFCKFLNSSISELPDRDEGAVLMWLCVCVCVRGTVVLAGMFVCVFKDLLILIFRANTGQSKKKEKRNAFPFFLCSLSNSQIQIINTKS